MGNDFSEMPARDDLQAVDERRLVRIDGGHEQPLVADLLQASGRDQHAVDMPDGAVERELAQERAAFEHAPARFRERDGDRHREVEPAAGLSHLRRREVHRQPLSRKCEAAVLDRRPNALARLFDRSRREPDEEEFRLAVGAVSLDLNATRFEAGEHARIDGGEHAPTLSG